MALLKARGKVVVWLLAGVAALALGGGALLRWQVPKAAAGLLLYPYRGQAPKTPPQGVEAVTYQGAGVQLAGWRKPAESTRRGTIIYLHGLGDTRASGAGLMRRFPPRGWDVMAYDSRGHGDSGGTMCTYGVWEKEDLRKVLDTLVPGPVVLLGASLGGAVALQAAAVDGRISAVIAAETFAELEQVAWERAPAGLSEGMFRRALRVAEERGHFRVAEASPVAVAPRVRVPVLLIHGEADTATRPAHSERILEALGGPKRLILVPYAQHNETLRGDPIWEEIDQWLEALNFPVLPHP